MGLNALRPAGGPGRLLWNYGWGPVSLFSAFAPLMFFNGMQFLSLLIRPFSRKLYRAYNRQMAFGVWGWWAWSIQRIVGVDVEITGDAVPPGESAIVIANHQSMGDVPVIMCLALAKGRVADTKWMVKDPVKYVPGVGWGLAFLDCVFLKRRWADDETTIRQTFAKYHANEPLWLVVFPEGTRLTPKKLAASQAYATKAGVPQTQHVLLPRTKGFAASVFGLKDRVDAVYDVTIRYVGAKTPTLVQLIRGDCDKVRMHVRRYPIDALPTGEAALGAWLTERLYEKDARLAAEGACPSPC
jgi:1-acyl-sn-glycerol-3-phosphate acyltransferase